FSSWGSTLTRFASTKRSCAPSPTIRRRGAHCKRQSSDSPGGDMNRLGLLALALAGAAYLTFWACTKDDPSFCVAPGPGCPVCNANRGQPALGGADGGGDAAPRCQTSTQCPLQGLKVCLMGTCVECQTFADCDEGQVCSVTHQCAGCAVDVDCASDYP